MPSTMIHLAVAHDVWPDAPGAFWVGNLAPDFTHDGQRKDRIHLRGVADRWAALHQLAMELHLEDSFSEGWLLHLFVDACWDEGPQRAHREAYVGDHWFHTYREEIGLATYWLFHHEAWSDAVWKQAMATPIPVADIECGPAPEEVALYRQRVYEKHRESDTGPSAAFPPELIRSFAAKTAERYGVWRARIDGR